MESGRVCGDEEGCWQDMGRGFLPVRAYVLTGRLREMGSAWGVTVCPEHSRGTGMFEGHKGMSHCSDAEWSGQHHLVKGQRTRKHCS